MKDINDDLLNRYLDNELNQIEKNSVKTAIENSSEVKGRFHSLLKTHNLLQSLEEEAPSIDFTKFVMKKLNRKTVLARQQKFFLFSVLSLLGLLIFGITGYVFYQVVSSLQPVHSSEIVTKYSKELGDYISEIFGQKNLTIFGLVLSFVMLVSGYFLYDFQKHSKNKYSH